MDKIAHKVVAILDGVVFFTGMCATAGFLGNFFWLCELLSHFRVHYLIILFPASAYYGCLLRLWPCSTYGALAVVQAIFVLPYFVGPSFDNADSRTFTAATVNVHVGTADIERFVTFIRSVDPEVFAVMECNRPWAAQVKRRFPDYPYSMVSHKPNFFGLALYGKQPFQETSMIPVGEYGGLVMKARTTILGRETTVFTVHPPPPMASELRIQRETEINTVCSMIRDTEGPVILLGDLNVTPWSPFFQRFVDAGLHDSRKGHGINTSWPTANPFLLLSIDHVLVSRHFVGRDFKTGGDIGSDHYPVWAKLSFVNSPSSTPTSQSP